MSDRSQYPNSLVDAFAQCIWIRLRLYLRLGPSADHVWQCDYADLPDISKAPLRLTARDMLDLTLQDETSAREPQLSEQDSEGASTP